jgi:hypothetical protein
MYYDELKVVLSLISSVLLHGNYSRNKLDRVFSELEYNKGSKMGCPVLDPTYVIFKNLVYDT